MTLEIPPEVFDFLRKVKEKQAAEAAPPSTNGGMRPKFKPFPHQHRAIQKLLQHGAIVAAHGVGSGKTFTSIAGHEKLRALGKTERALIVVPAGLRTNFEEAVKEFTTSSVQIVGPKNEKSSVYVTDIDPNKTYTIISYNMFRKDPEGLMKATGARTLVFDEFHKARTKSGATYRAAVKARKHAAIFIGLTGSIVNNDPSDIVPLLDIASRDGFMSTREFDARYKKRVAKAKGFWGGTRYLVRMKNLPDLRARAGHLVDYISSDDLGKAMPRKEVDTVNVDMSAEQKKLYDFAMKKVGPVTRFRIRHNLPMNQSQARHVFAQIQQARQASNSVHTLNKKITAGQAAESTPKVKRLLDDTIKHLNETPDGKVVLYSNLINGGVDVLSAGLKARGIDHAIFVGKGRQIGDQKITSEVRTQGVADYKSGKKKVIVLSGAGAEGLDLKNSTMFQSLDAHFNPERMLQAEARARRIKGLAHRPEEQRVIKVKRYFSTAAKPGLFKRMLGKKRETTTDQWVYNVAKRKHTLNSQLRKVLKPEDASTVRQKAPAPPPRRRSAPRAQKTKKTFRSVIRKYRRRWKDFRTGKWRYEYPE